MTDADKGITFSETNRTEIRKRVGSAAKIFDQYSDEIRAIIHFNTKDKSKADDIFQNFFVSIVRKPIPPDIEDIRRYLYRAVTNDVIDVARQKKCHQDHIKKYAEGCKSFIITEDPQNIAIQVESTKKMFQLIESCLSKREAEAILQRYGRGFNTTDTAKSMHVDKRIVSRYLSLALKKIREFIPENEDDDI